MRKAIIRKSLGTKVRGGEIDRNDLAYAQERVKSPIKYAIPAPRGGKAGINPHVSRFILENGQTVSVFHVKPVYYATPAGQWRPLYEIASYYGNRGGMVLKEGWESRVDFGYLTWYLKRQKLIHGRGVAIEIKTGVGSPLKLPLLVNTVTTVYPNPDPGVTSMDGFANYLNAATWATAHDAADGTGADPSNATTNILARKDSDTNWDIARGFYLFDTSSLPDTDTIDSAIFSLAGTGTAEINTDTTTIVLVSSSPASNTTITTADYDQVGSTSFGSMNLGDWNQTAETYNDITLNASGLADITKQEFLSSGLG